MSAGRPSTFTHELFDAICDRIADGASLRAICEGPEFPSRGTVLRWIGGSTELQNQYALACEERAESHADDIVGIADEECTMVRAEKHGTQDDDGEGRSVVVFDATAVARNRLRVDARKWVASKLKPKKYGERVAVDHGIQDVLADRLKVARERATEG